MNAAQLVIRAQEYRQAVKDYLGTYVNDTDNGACNWSSKRFLARLVLRAVVDISMYKEDNPHHISAKNWVLGKTKAVVAFSDLLALLGMDSMEDKMIEAAEVDGEAREQIRELKKHFYNWDSDAGEG